jgi:hypothetical protein
MIEIAIVHHCHCGSGNIVKNGVETKQYNRKSNLISQTFDLGSFKSNFVESANGKLGLKAGVSVAGGSCLYSMAICSPWNVKTA